MLLSRYYYVVWRCHQKLENKHFFPLARFIIFQVFFPQPQKIKYFFLDFLMFLFQRTTSHFINFILVNDTF